MYVRLVARRASSVPSTVSRRKARLPRLVASLISGSRSGSVGIEPSAPKIYDVWREGRERAGPNERKVNKNLGEITVPRGKLRLISALPSPSFYRASCRAACVPRSSTIPTVSLALALRSLGIIFHPLPRHEESPIIESSHDVSSAEERLKTDRNVFHFLPEGLHDLLRSPSRPSPLPLPLPLPPHPTPPSLPFRFILFSFHLGASRVSNG